VWPAYIVSFLVISALAAAIWRRSRRLKARLAEIERARDENR
ncbi:MAG: heme exporter protein CcmD, partial [Marinicaulis sp.]|nr:heme exporter protein CcmD [Marinicaulis sp.]